MRLINKVLWICSFALLLNGCVEQAEKQATLEDGNIEPFRHKLLDEAFGFATAIPLEPHIKDRARHQEMVVSAALELNQVSRAIQYAAQIPNWRRGQAYADYAFYSVSHGVTNGVADLLALADKAARNAEQDWRRERVWARIAQTWSALDRPGMAAEYRTAPQESEIDTTGFEKTERYTDEKFKEYTGRLDSQLAIGGLDLQKNALYVYAALYDQFYAMPVRRDLIEGKMISGWGKLPHFDRIDLLSTLTETALNHEDQQNATRLADMADSILDGAEWPAEYHVQLLAKIATLRLACGDADAAELELKAALEIFAENKKKIVDIYRAEALIPVAEAFASAKAFPKALEVYAMAVEESVQNANSRPRAEDLCQIELSMARMAVEPTEALWSRMAEIKDGLGDPW